MGGARTRLVWTRAAACLPVPGICGLPLIAAICGDLQDVRLGLTPRLSTVVTLSLLDDEGTPADINVTGIVMNKLTASWKCECRSLHTGDGLGSSGCCAAGRAASVWAAAAP